MRIIDFNSFVIGIIFFLTTACQSHSIYGKVKRQADFGGIMMEGAATVLETIQQGAAMKHKFSVTAPGGAGISNDFAAGTGDAFDAAVNKGKDMSRRKRSLQLGSRLKRQANEFDYENMANGSQPNENSTFSRIKEIFANVVDAAKDMIQKLRETMGNSPKGYNPSASVETLK